MVLNEIFAMKNRLALAALVLWGVTVAGAGFMFVRGRTAPASDGRTAVLLAPADRDFVLAEMRNLLEATQNIAAALAEDDRAKLAAAARLGGRGSVKGVPADLLVRLPVDFKQAGMAMHGGLDMIAEAADRGESMKQLNARLADQLNLCVGCHQTYRIDAVH